MNAGGGTAAPPPPPPPPPAATTATPPPADPPPAEKKAFKGDVNGSRINIPGHIVYDTGKATIKPESEPTLTQLKQFLLDNTQVTTLRIEGHTDSDGDDAMNLKLSGERALACVNWLVKNGIDRARLIAVGFGETKPVGPNDTPANKEQNRRTEFHVAGVNGKGSFLGRPADGGGTVFKLVEDVSRPPERAPRRGRALFAFVASRGYGAAVRSLWFGFVVVLAGCGKEGVREWTASDHDVPPNAAAAPTRPGKASAAVDAQAEMVELTWQRQCVSCHGPDGRGDGPQGPSSQAADLTKRAWQEATNDAQIQTSILNGKGRMPKFDLPAPLVDGLVKRIRSRRAP